MLTNDQVSALRIAFEKIADPVNEYLIQDIARRVAQAGQLTSTTAYQIWRAQNLGMSRKEIEKAVAAILKKSAAEVRELFKQAAEVGYRFDLDQLPTANAIPFEDNTSVQQIVEAAVKLADEQFQNITQTLGFQTPDGTVHPLMDAYQKTTDYAFQQVISGAADYNTAIRQACRKLADGGVKTIDYASGVRTSLEAAIRRNMMGGLGLMVEQISQKNHDDLGADGWELSAHANSAPDHEPFQGRQYTDEAYTKLNDMLQRRIGTLNCGHNAFPIILGVNEPQYTKEQLEKFREDNEKGITFEGRHYTGYEATQMQRKLERSIRAQKRRVLAAESSGDKEGLTLAKTRLQVLRQNYSRFSKAAGLRTENERLFVSDFNKKRENSVFHIRRTNEFAAGVVENGAERATMGARKAISEGISVQKIGTIDIEKYRVVSDRIRTDEVVISDERIGHIKDHHPNDFERYSQYIAEMLQSPQYILEDPVPNTAVILNEFAEAGEHFRLILKLAVIEDEAYKKNSVITFLKISEKKFRKYLRNKKILYKSE